jgi:hypothetical protein
MESTFFSWYYEGKEPESDYQLKRKSPAMIVQENPEIPLEKHLEKIREDLNNKTSIDFLKWLIIGQPSDITGFLNFHYDKFKEHRPGREFDFLFHIDENTEGEKGLIFKKLDTSEEQYLSESKRKLIKDWIATQKKKLEEEQKNTQGANNKIKWNGSPEILGFLFLELVHKGYIDPPLYHGKPNFTGLSRLVGQTFALDSTPGNLERAFNESNNQLTDYKRDRFEIPPLSEIA